MTPIPEQCVTPARCPWTHEEWMRYGRAMNQLDDMHNDIKEIKEKLERLDDYGKNKATAHATSGSIGGVLGGVLVALYAAARSHWKWLP